MQLGSMLELLARTKINETVIVGRGTFNQPVLVDRSQERGKAERNGRQSRTIDVINSLPVTKKERQNRPGRINQHKMYSNHGSIAAERRLESVRIGHIDDTLIQPVEENIEEEFHSPIQNYISSQMQLPPIHHAADWESHNEFLEMRPIPE